MAPALLPRIALQARTVLSHLAARSPGSANLDNLGPLAAGEILLARDNSPSGADPSSGIIHPGDINNNAVFALFGVIAAAFVIAGIWFFFWAKNGGFYFKKDDWDDYKTTVLRRRGPNGTLLSNATPSTNLGGGSVYKDVDDGTEDTRTTVTSSTGGLTGITAGASDIAGREKRRRKREQQEREKERRREERAARGKGGERKLHKSRNTGRKVGEDGVLMDEEATADAKEQLRSYRHEKAARVGGINKDYEGSAWDGSTNPSNSTAAESTAATSELMGNRERTPTNTPTKKTASGGGIRKVYSTADRTAERESERVRAEARRLQEKGRAASSSHRRDFSFQRSGDAQQSSGSRGEGGGGDDKPTVPGSWTESEVGESDLGTKVYHHPLNIPGTSTSDFAYAEEKRKKRASSGYRRSRNDDE